MVRFCGPKLIPILVHNTNNLNFQINYVLSSNVLEGVACIFGEYFAILEPSVKKETFLYIEHFRAIGSVFIT